MMLENEIKKSKDLARNIKTYNALISRKDTDFEYYVTHVFNPELKKKAYKNKINRQIYILNKFSKRRDRLLYSSDLPENQEKKKKNRYCIKRAELEKLKSDEYIDKNIESIVVRYKEVDPAVFELEINGAQKVEGVVTTGNLVVGRTKESSTIILSMLALSMLTTSFVLSISGEEFENNMIAFWHYCLKAAEDTGIVLWQFFNGSLRTRKIVSTQLTKPYAGRNVVLQAYLNWRFETNATNSHAYETLKEEFDKEVVEVEVEDDEYQKLIENQ